MVVQHNLTAMNSNRMLGVTTKSQAKSTEKLSSGYKINRAADDAAGLSISEKMRKQIRGLTQASSNAQDGISAVQTAEGALNEVQDMLQRMNELAVKSSNGTMSENDRSYVQNEVDQLVTEIDRVAETTKFNETYLLKGDSEGKSAATGTTLTATTGGTAVTLGANTITNAGDYALGTVGVATSFTAAGAGVSAVSYDDTNTKGNALINSSTTGVVTFSAALDGVGTALTNSTWTASIVTSSGTNTISISGDDLDDYGITATVGATITAADTIVLTKKLTQSAEQTQDLTQAGLSYTAASATAVGLKDVNVGNDLLATIKVDDAGAASINAYDPNAQINALQLSLHVGADSTNNNKISVDVESMSAKSLGLKTDTGAALRVDGKDSTNADAAIDTIAAAVQKVSTQRSALGAIQNRLEHTINNLDNVVENTTSAESAIRDTNMATEMVKYSNNNILSQAGQAMLAQANQSNQGVLSLLQ